VNIKDIRTMYHVQKVQCLQPANLPRTQDFCE
jgi:hypothetical protein